MSYQDVIEELQDKVREQADYIELINQSPKSFAEVLEIRGSRDEPRVVLATAESVMEVAIEKQLRRALAPGRSVYLTQSTGAVVGVAEPLAYGKVFTVSRLVGKQSVEVSGDDSSPLVVLLGSGPVEVGDRVLLNQGHSVVLKKIGKKEKKFSYETVERVAWADIGGLEEAKAAMIEAIELPHKHPDLYRKYGKRPLKGVLLSGPPGCGKTMLGKAAATALAALHGESASTGFIYVKGPELLNMWVGNTEAAIRGLFEQGRAHKKEHGYPAVLFIDEAEAVLSKRGEAGGRVFTSTTVPQFLAEMDGLEDSGTMVLLATNRPDALDPAVVREGRIDRKVRVTRPTREAVEEIFKINLTNKPLGGGAVKKFAQVATDELYADEHVLYSVPGPRGSHKVRLRDIASGALIAGVVDQATSLALHRDMRSGKLRGLTLTDFKEAAALVANANRGVEHQLDNEEIAAIYEAA